MILRLWNIKEENMAIIHLFKDNAKHVDSVYLYQDYRRYSIERVWKLTFWTDKLYKSRWELTADKVEDFVGYIEEIFSDYVYAKTKWEDIRDNNYYHNELQLKLF